MENKLSTILLSIAQSFSEYFIDNAMKIYGKRPKKLDFTNITLNQKVGTTGIQLVTVHYSTELGVVRAGLAVKIYNEEQDATNLVDKIGFLLKRLSPFEKQGIHTPKILFSKGSVVVMEGIKGDSFRYSLIPEVEKFRLAGKSLASFHGFEAFKPNYQFDLLNKVFEILPIHDKDKEDLKPKFEAEYKAKVKNQTKSACVLFGDFHSGNILFEVDFDNSPVMTSHLIDPEFLDPIPRYDRLEDIANFFIYRSINEFYEKNSLVEVEREIKAFLAGYNEIMAYRNKDFLKSFYPQEFPLNYYLAQGILMSIPNLLETTNSSTDDSFYPQLQNRLELINNLITGEILAF